MQKNAFIKVSIDTPQGVEVVEFKAVINTLEDIPAQCRQAVADYLTSKEWLKDGFKRVNSTHIDFAYYVDMGVRPIIVDNFIVSYR